MGVRVSRIAFVVKTGEKAYLYGEHQFVTAILRLIFYSINIYINKISLVNKFTKFLQLQIFNYLCIPLKVRILI